MEYIRSVYRVEVNGPHCTVTARFGGRVATGMALDISTAGLGATFLAGEASPNLLPDLGDLGELTINADWCRDSVVVDARVVHRADTAGDLCILGFEFTASPADTGPYLKDLFNRRRTVRVRPPRDRPVDVIMTSANDSEVKGTLLDISSTGASFEATVTSQRSAGYTRSVSVVIGLGHDSESLRVPAVIRNRRCGDPTMVIGQWKLIYGVGFMVPGSQPKLQLRIDAYVKNLHMQMLSPSAT